MTSHCSKLSSTLTTSVRTMLNKRYYGYRGAHSSKWLSPININLPIDLETGPTGTYNILVSIFLHSLFVINKFLHYDDGVLVSGIGPWETAMIVGTAINVAIANTMKAM